MNATWTTLFLSILRARRRGLLKLRRAPKNITLHCLRDKCPRNCCWVFDMIQLEPNEISISKLEKKEISGVFYLSQKQYPCPSDKACSAFVNGQCSVYSIRPKSCREYPWYRFGDSLYFDCRCPGITNAQTGYRPNIHDLMDSSRYFSSLPRWIRQPLLWILIHL